MENTAVLNIRISEQLKHKLEELAKERDETVSDLVREMLETAVTQDNDSISGIPPKLMAQMEAEAERRSISVTDLMARLILMAWGRFRRDLPKNVFALH